MPVPGLRGDDPDHAGRLRGGEVEEGAGDRVGAARDLGDLVRPARVPDPAVDRGVHQRGGLLRADALGGGHLGGELLAAALQHLGHPVQHLARLYAVVPDQPLTAARAARTASRASLRVPSGALASHSPFASVTSYTRPLSERGNFPPTYSL